MGSKVNWELAYQEMDSLIPPEIFAESKRLGRVKPWGTAHALLCAAGKIDAPFAIINADDFYGREAYTVVGNHLSGQYADEPVIVPYSLEKTLSEQGTVSRGVCQISDNYLLSVEELSAIEKKEGKIINTNPDGSVIELAADCPVSMNFWGFPQTILAEFKKYFDEFLSVYSRDIPNQIKRECYIPLAVDNFIKNKIIRVKSLPADSQWFGITYREDRDFAVKRLSELTSSGIYPESLWL